MANPINSLHGQTSVRPRYSTVVVDVNKDGSTCNREIVLNEDAPSYEDMTLQNLLDAGIDPATVATTMNSNNRVESFDQLNDFANSIKE